MALTTKWGIIQKQTRNIHFFLLIIPIIFFITGCYPKNDQSTQSGYEKLQNSLKKENKALAKLRKQEKNLESTRREKVEKDIEPLLPSYDPLEDVPISLSVHQQPLHTVLNIIARNAGLNLIVNPDISIENNVTVSFESTPSSVVMEKLMHAFDLAWKVEDNCLYVQRYEERTFELDFLNTSTQANISSGGDIFGSSKAEGGSNNFTGDFSIQTDLVRGDDNDSLYGYLLQNVEKVLQSGQKTEGEVNLDSVSGNLYVRSSPRKVQKISRIVENLKSKMQKQVVIDARILEVQLNDSFNLGIDWNYIVDTMIENYNLKVDFGWISDSGFGTNKKIQGDTPAQPLIITDPEEDIESKPGVFQSTVNALQTFGDLKTISNPHVRVRHAQPALVTSGTTKSYIKEITRDENEESGTTSFSTDTASAFEGVMLGVIPFITSKHEVDLQIFPINSEVDLSEKSSVGGDQITLPTVDVRNVNTNVQVRSGDTIILGGLIYKQGDKNNRQAPGIGNIPLLGWLAKNRSESSTIRELVIIMHVQVI
jgi:MSHA type pilus biogenesis protein MshL